MNARNAKIATNSSILTYTEWLAGYTYTWHPLTWRQEYESYDSNFTAYKQLLSQLEGSHRINSTLNWGWFAGFIDTNYQKGTFDTPDYSHALFAGTTLHGSIGRRGYWELEAQARKETGLLDETLLGVVSKAGWRWRRLRFEAGARFEQQDRFNTSDEHIHAFFQVAREFGRARSQ